MTCNHPSLWKNYLKFACGLCVLFAHQASGATSEGLSIDLPKPFANFENSQSDVIEQNGIITLKVNFSHEFIGQLTYSVDGSADQGVDFAPPELTIETSRPVDEIDIAINLRDDEAIEDLETLRVTLQPGEEYELGSARQHTVSIKDNDTNWRVVHDVDGTQFDYGMQITRNGDETAAKMVSSGRNGLPAGTFPVKLIKTEDSQFEAIVGPVMTAAGSTLLGAEVARTFSLIANPSAVSGHEIDYERSLVGSVTEKWSAVGEGALYLTSGSPKISGAFAMFRTFEEDDPWEFAEATAVSKHSKAHSECNVDEIAKTVASSRAAVQAALADNIPYYKIVREIITQADASLYLDNAAAFRYKDLISGQVEGNINDYWTCKEKLRAHEVVHSVIGALQYNPWNQRLRRILLDIYYGIAEADRVSALEKQVAVQVAVAELKVTMTQAQESESIPIIDKEIAALEEVLVLYHDAFADYMKGFQNAFDFDAVDYIKPLVQEVFAVGILEELALQIESSRIEPFFRQVFAELAHEESSLRVAPDVLALLVRQSLAEDVRANCVICPSDYSYFGNLLVQCGYSNSDIARISRSFEFKVSTTDYFSVDTRYHTSVRKGLGWFVHRALAKRVHEERDMRMTPASIKSLVRQTIEELAHEERAIESAIRSQVPKITWSADAGRNFSIAPGEVEPFVRQTIEELAHEERALRISSGDVKRSVLNSLFKIFNKSCSNLTLANAVDIGDRVWGQPVVDVNGFIRSRPTLKSALSDPQIRFQIRFDRDPKFTVPASDPTRNQRVAGGVHIDGAYIGASFIGLGSADDALDEFVADAHERLVADAVTGLVADAHKALYADALANDDSFAFAELAADKLDALVADAIAGIYADAHEGLVAGALDGLFADVITGDDSNAFSNAFSNALSSGDNTFYDALNARYADAHEGLVAAHEGLVAGAFAELFAGLLADGDADLFSEHSADALTDFFAGDADALAEIFADTLVDDDTSAHEGLVADALAEFVADALAKDAFFGVARKQGFRLRAGTMPELVLDTGKPEYKETFARQRDFELLFELLSDYLRTAEELTKLYVARGENDDFMEANRLFNSALQSAYLGGHGLLAMFPEIREQNGNADASSGLKDAVAGWRLSYRTLANLRSLLSGGVNILGYPDDILILPQSVIPGDDQSFHSFQYFKNQLGSPSNPLTHATSDLEEAERRIEIFKNNRDQYTLNVAERTEYYNERLLELVGVSPDEPGYDERMEYYDEKLLEIIGVNPVTHGSDNPMENFGKIAQQLRKIEFERNNIKQNKQEIDGLEARIHILRENREKAERAYSELLDILITHGDEQVSLSEEIKEIQREQNAWERGTAIAKDVVYGAVEIGVGALTTGSESTQTTTVGSEGSSELSSRGGMAEIGRGTARIIGAGFDTYNAVIQHDLEKIKNSREISKEKLALTDQVKMITTQADLYDAEILVQIQNLYSGMRSLQLASANAAVRYRSELSMLVELLHKKEDWERRKAESEALLAGRYFADPSHEFLKDAALLRSESSFSNAQRWLFLATRAAEYKWNTKLEDRQVLFKARNARELKDFSRLLTSWDDKKKNEATGRNDGHEKEFSIRDHFLGVRINSKDGEAYVDWVKENQKIFHDYLGDKANYLDPSAEDNPIPGFKVLKFNFSTAYTPYDGGLFMENRWNEKIVSLEVKQEGGAVGRTTPFVDGFLYYGDVALVRNRAKGAPDPDDPSRLVNETTAYSMQSWNYENGRWVSKGAFGAPISIIAVPSSNIKPENKEIDIFKEFSVAATNWRLFVAVENKNGVPLLDVDCSDGACLNDIKFKINYYWYKR